MQGVLTMVAFTWLSPVTGGDSVQFLAPKLPAVKTGLHGSKLDPIFDPSASIVERVNIVHWLSRDLSADDISSLFEFLAKPNDTREKNIAGLHFLKNEIWERLRSQSRPPANFTQMTIRVIEDPRQDIVTRDYAIQHLASWYEQGATDAPDAKTRIQSVLIQMTKQNSTLAATAILALQHLSELPLDAPFQPDESVDSFGNTALRIATSGKASAAMRITAIQICALQGKKEIVPLLESLAETAGRPALQISAIAALGKLGAPKDVLFLRHLEAENNEQLRPAITAALKQLDDPLAGRGFFGDRIR